MPRHEEVDAWPPGPEPGEGSSERIGRRSFFKRTATGIAVAGGAPALVAACGGSGGGGDGGGSPAGGRIDAQGADPASVGEKTLGVIPIVGSAEPAARWISGLQEEAEAGGWRVQVTDANGDFNKAVGAWQNYLRAGVDGLVAAGFEPNQWGPQIRAANAAKVPYVSIYSSWAPGVEANIGANYFVQGAELATFVIDRFEGKGGVIIMTSRVTPSLALRSSAFRSALEDLSEMRVLATHEVDLTKIQQDAASATQSLLQRFPKGEVAAIFGGFVDIGLAASEAVKSTGRTEIVTLGTDGNRRSLEAIRKGDPFQATTGDNFEAVGRHAARQLAQVMSGKRALGRQLYVDAPVVAALNAPESGYFEASGEVYTYSPYEV